MSFVDLLRRKKPVPPVAGILFDKVDLTNPEHKAMLVDRLLEVMTVSGKQTPYGMITHSEIHRDQIYSHMTEYVAKCKAHIAAFVDLKLKVEGASRETLDSAREALAACIGASGNQSFGETIKNAESFANQFLYEQFAIARGNHLYL